MPFHLRLDDEARLLRVAANGPVDCDESLRAIRSAASELAGRGWGAVTDVRAMDYVPSIAELRLIALEFIRLRPAFAGGVAFVVSNDIHYGLGRLLAGLTEARGISIGVTRSVEEAEAWLRRTP